MTGDDTEQYECYDCLHYKPDLRGGGGIGGFGSCPFRASVRAWSPICDRFQDDGEWKHLTEAYARPDECPWMGSGICWWSRGYCSSQAFCEADLGPWGAWRSCSREMTKIGCAIWGAQVRGLGGHPAVRFWAQGGSILLDAVGWSP